MLLRNYELFKERCYKDNHLYETLIDDGYARIEWCQICGKYIKYYKTKLGTTGCKSWKVPRIAQ